MHVTEHQSMENESKCYRKHDGNYFNILIIEIYAFRYLEKEHLRKKKVLTPDEEDRKKDWQT